MNEPICAWCPYTEQRHATERYGSIPLCRPCYRYATQSDKATRERLARPVRLPMRKREVAA